MSAAGYSTVTVGSNDVHSVSVGSNETLENVLYDVTATGAEVVINASGSGWTVRNVGIRGPTYDRGDRPIMRLTGNGTVEHCYLGDGAALHGTRRVGIIVPGGHSGHVELNEMLVQGVSSSALYAAGPARSGEGGGTVAVRNSLFRNNNVSHLRIAADGSLASNVTIYNTNEVPALGQSVGGSNDVVLSRGLYTSYGDTSQTVEVRNCDIEVTDDNTCTGGQGYNSCGADALVAAGGNSFVEVYDSEVVGNLAGDDMEFVSGNGSNPDLTAPAGVPMTADEAASGTSSAGNGGDGNGDTTPTFDHTLVFQTVDGSPASQYTFETTGEIAPRSDAETGSGGNDSFQQLPSGNWQASGEVGNGFVDSWNFNGQVVDFTGSSPASDWSLELDGATVTVEGLIEATAPGNGNGNGDENGDDENGDGNGETTPGDGRQPGEPVRRGSTQAAIAMGALTGVVAQNASEDVSE